MTQTRTRTRVTMYSDLDSGLNLWDSDFRLVISREFSWFQDLFTNLPLPQNVLERREVTTKEKKEVACVVSKPLGSCLWRVCKSSKIKHPGGSGGFVLHSKGRPRPATHFSGCFYFCQITPLGLGLLSPKVDILVIINVVLEDTSQQCVQTEEKFNVNTPTKMSSPRANFIELLSREFCLANTFAKQYKTDYQPKCMHFVWKFGW